MAAEIITHSSLLNQKKTILLNHNIHRKPFLLFSHSFSVKPTKFRNDVFTKMPLSVSNNKISISVSVKEDKKKKLNPIVVIDNYDSFTYNLCQEEKKKRSLNPIIVIDNYDSFTYNLCQYMGELGCDFQVYRNDELSVEDLKKKNPRGVLISPGPGTPQDSGISLQTVLKLGPTVPLFGVCMGLQCIGEAFGGKIVRAPNGVMHGKSSLVYYNEGEEGGLFTGLSNPFTAGRYHSLVIEKESFPHDALEITAWTEDGLVMAARHKTYKHIVGVQFHPESIITSEGRGIVKNFIKLIEKVETETQR